MKVPRAVSWSIFLVISALLTTNISAKEIKFADIEKDFFQNKAVNLTYSGYNADGECVVELALTHKLGKPDSSALHVSVQQVDEKGDAVYKQTLATKFSDRIDLTEDEGILQFEISNYGGSEKSKLNLVYDGAKFSTEKLNGVVLEKIGKPNDVIFCRALSQVFKPSPQADRKASEMAREDLRTKLNPKLLSTNRFGGCHVNAKVNLECSWELSRNEYRGTDSGRGVIVEFSIDKEMPNQILTANFIDYSRGELTPIKIPKN